MTLNAGKNFADGSWKQLVDLADKGGDDDVKLVKGKPEFMRKDGKAANRRQARQRQARRPVLQPRRFVRVWSRATRRRSSAPRVSPGLERHRHRRRLPCRFSE